MSAPAAATESPPAPAPTGALRRPPARSARAGGWERSGSVAAAVLAVAGALCFVTFEAGGGLTLASMTVTEIALTLASGLLVAGAVLLARRAAPAYGVWPVALLLALTALTAISVGWSVTPDSSWQDAGRMLAYSGVFACAVALVRVWPRLWMALLGGIVLASVTICGYALLTKVFPGQLDAQDAYARLQEPYGYWNAIGLTASLGAIASMWLGARRTGHALLSASAYPATGVLLVTLLLAYSRGALAALAVGIVVWMAIVPLRLRSARVLIVGALGAAPIVAWDFSTHALSSDGVALHARATAGHQLGVLLAAMLLALAIAGVAVEFSSARRPPSPQARRRAAAALIALVVLAVVALGGGLAASRRGLAGTISHDVRSLADPNAPLPSNTPGRLTAIGSVRARYWKEALEAFGTRPALGVGASGYEVARLRYRSEPQEQVRHAHGYVVQTLSDLGLVGLVLTLALLAAWLACAARAARPLDGRLLVQRRPARAFGVSVSLPSRLSWERARSPYSPERIGLLAMLCLVVTFGAHSFVDWTWYVPGTACVALLCAGWLAGRGPLRTAAAAAGEQSSRGDVENTLVLPAAAPGDGGDGGGRGSGREERGPRHVRPGPLGERVKAGREWLSGLGGRLSSLRWSARALAVAGGAVALALLTAWTQWQPQRSVQASEEALALLSRKPAAAMRAAQTAVERDPLSAQALFTLAAVQRADGQLARGRSTLQKAVRLQPSNPQTWLELGLYDVRERPRSARQELRAAVYLDPHSIQIQNAYVEALRVLPLKPAAPKPASRGAGTASRGAGTASRGAGTASRGAGATGRSAARGRTAGRPLAEATQKRARTAFANSTGRAPGAPPTARTSTGSKPKSASRAASVRRV